MKNRISGLRLGMMLALMAGLAAPAMAQDHDHHDHSHGEPVTAGSLQLSDPWVRATLPAARTGGGYLTITNDGAEADRLLAVESPAAARVELHEMRMQGDQMQMRALEDGIAVPAGTTVELAPGGLHIMFMGLAAPFVEGETVPVTLQFEAAGAVELALDVRPIGADGQDHDHDHGDDHGHGDPHQG